jgi:hypothetical protein
MGVRISEAWRFSKTAVGRHDGGEEDERVRLRQSSEESHKVCRESIKFEASFERFAELDAEAWVDRSERIDARSGERYVITNKGK